MTHVVYKRGIIYVGAEKESKNLNSTGKKSELQRRKEQQVEALLQSADGAGHRRSLLTVSSRRRSSDQPASEDDDSAAEAYHADFLKLVLKALLRSVDATQWRRSSVLRFDEEWSSKMDRKTAACLYDGGDVCNLTTPIDEKLRRAINEDVQSEGGHRAVVLQGAEGTGRTTALRRFVHLVAESFPDLPPPVVVSVNVTWPGRTAIDLLCDVVTQLDAVVDVDYKAIDDDTGLPAFIGCQRVDLDSLVRSFCNILRTFSESSPGRLVIAVDGLENVRQSVTVSGGDLKWLATPLPMRVHVVATYLTGPEPDTSSPVSTVVGGRTVRTIDIAELSESTINNIVVDAFRRRRRQTPVDGRLSVIMQAIGTKSQAAYVALMADEFAARSATMSSTSGQTEKCFERLGNIEKIAKERFKRAENHYGKSVVCTITII